MLAVRVYSPNPVGCVDFVVYLNDQTIDFITYHTEVAVFVLRRKSTILFYAKNDKLKERTQNFYLAFLRIRWLRSKRDEWRMKTKPIKWFSVWIFFFSFRMFYGFCIQLQTQIHLHLQTDRKQVVCRPTTLTPCCVVNTQIKYRDTLKYAFSCVQTVAWNAFVLTKL